MVHYQDQEFFLDAFRASKRRNYVFSNKNIKVVPEGRTLDKVRAIIILSAPQGYFFVMLDEGRQGFPFLKFPGGHLEKNEWPETAMTRELKEELGIDIYMGEKNFLGSIETGCITAGIFVKVIVTENIKDFVAKMKSRFIIRIIPARKLMLNGELPQETYKILEFFLIKSNPK